ncbi:MAG: vitamin B12 dependent-methionine synthase activation domain-containing protein [Bilifractor sp.]|jgi:hypothetical protein|nr:vitamin B12 dependent-methionine synthase activation domain-containing protein [Lachnospiraceae bacterium]
MLGFNRNEMLRYLGFRNGALPDAEMQQNIDRLTDELQRVIAPKSVAETYDVTVTESTVSFAGLTIPSRDLAKNLKGCVRVCLFAATLGVGPDRLIARSQVRKMSDALICQAASAAMIEAYCNEIDNGVGAEAAKEGLYTRPRFSPGYGDCPIEVQTDFTRILNTPKKIGLTLTDSLMMMPSKSVTAVIGITPVPTHHHAGGCATCTVKGCAFREG